MNGLRHLLPQALVLSVGGSLMGMAIAVGTTLAQPLSFAPGYLPRPVDSSPVDSRPVDPRETRDGAGADRGINALNVSSGPSATSPRLPSAAPFTAEHIQYFLEIALGSEFSTAVPKIHKWRNDVRIQYTGNPTAEDLKTLSAVIDEVNQLTQHQIRLQLVNENPNVTVHFVPESQFSNYEVNYRPVNYGFFWTQWQDDTITHANILIATQDVTQKERSHLIREELTQSLGLMQDSWRYPDSLFYQGWTDPTQYTEIDKVLLQMLYHPALQSGMSRAEVLEVLERSPAAAGVNQPPLQF